MCVPGPRRPQALGTACRRRRGGGGLDARVLAVEALDAAGDVQQPLLAGEEGVAGGADLQAHLLLRGPGGPGGAAGAVDVDDGVVGMDSSLHGTPLAGREPRPQTLIIPQQRPNRGAGACHSEEPRQAGRRGIRGGRRSALGAETADSSGPVQSVSLGMTGGPAFDGALGLRIDNGQRGERTDNGQRTTDNGPDIAPSRPARSASRWCYPTAIPSRKSLLLFVLPSLSRISSMASVCERGERTLRRIQTRLSSSRGSRSSSLRVPDLLMSTAG